MKQKAVIGTFFDRMDNAEYHALKRSKEVCLHKGCKESHFTVVEYEQGFLVVGDRQLVENLE